MRLVKVFVALVMLLVTVLSASAVSEFSISGFEEWDNSVVNSFSANVSGLPYLSPYAAALYEFNWTTDDSSGNGNDGVLNGYTVNNGTISGATTGVSGQYGEGVSFDGDTDYIDIGSEINFTTLEFWIYPIAEGTFNTMFSKNDYSAGFSIHDTGYFRIFVGTGTNFNYKPNFNEWNHVVLLYDGSNYELWHNGIFKQEIAKNEYAIQKIGRSNAATIDGSIDEVRIYDFALTPEQINESMNSHYPVETPVLSYSFEAYNASHVFDTNWNTQGQDEAETGEINFDGVDDYMSVGSISTFADNFSLSFWFEAKEYQTDMMLITNRESNNDNRIHISTDNLNNRLTIGADDGPDSNIFNMNNEFLINEWNNVIIVKRGNNLSAYWNGVFDNSASGDGIDGDLGSTKNLIFGRFGDLSVWNFNGSMSDIRIYDRSLSADEVGYLYDSQAITYELATTDGTIETQIPNSSPYTYNISVAASDFFPQSFSNRAVSSNLSVFFNQSVISFDSFEKFTGDQLTASYILVNASGSGISYNEGSSDINTLLNSGVTTSKGIRLNITLTDIYVYNVTVDSQESGTTRAKLLYDNGSVIEITTNRSGDTYYFSSPILLNVGSVYRVEFDDNGGSYNEAYNTTTNNVDFGHWSILGGSVNGGATTNLYNLAFIGFTGGKVLSENETVNIPVGNGYEAIANVPDYYNKTITFDVAALDNKTVNVSGLFDFILNVVFKDQANATITNSTVINISSDYYNASNTTSVGLFTYYLLSSGSYSFSTLPAGFALNEFSISGVPASAEYSQTYYDTHYTTNSIQFYFRDEDSDALVTETVTVELISDVASYNYSTSNGTLFVDLISPAEYNIRYSAPSYSERNYYFTMSDFSFNNLTLYLANASDTTEVTINVFDTLQNPLEAARVKILKYDPGTNSYVIVSVKETNFQGKLKEYLSLGSEYYKFIVEYEGDTVLTTTASYIFDSEVTLYANLLTGGFSELFRLTGLYGEISYSGGNVVYTWNDEDGLVSQGCVYAFLQTDAGLVANGSACGSGAANTIYLPVANTSGLTYFVKGYVDKNGFNIYLTNFWLPFGDEFDTGRTGLVLSFILLSVFVFVGFWRLEVAVVFGGFGLLVLTIANVVHINISYGVGVFILSLVSAYIIGRRGGGAV